MQITRGREVDVTVEDGTIVVRPLSVPQYSLQDLLAKVTDVNRHDVVDWGSPVGREIW